MTYNEPTKWDKIVPAICILILLAFFACLPSMIADKNRREAQLWHDLGCHKYDEMKGIDVPAKCSNTFTDHYQPQAPRLQPPDER